MDEFLQLIQTRQWWYGVAQGALGSAAFTFVLFLIARLSTVRPTKRWLSLPVNVHLMTLIGLGAYTLITMQGFSLDEIAFVFTFSFGVALVTYCLCFGWLGEYQWDATIERIAFIPTYLFTLLVFTSAWMSAYDIPRPSPVFMYGFLSMLTFMATALLGLVYRAYRMTWKWYRRTTENAARP